MSLPAIGIETNLTASGPARPTPSKVDSGTLGTAVVVSWISQFIQIASGFLVPRLIEARLGRELLGVWDLGWSLTSYFMLLEGGIGAAVNRHTAMYFSAKDMASVNRVVSSVAAVQRLVGTLIVAGCLVMAMFVDSFAPGLSPSELTQARWLIVILGSSIGITMYGGVYVGVLTGCQRWTLHHTIYTFESALSLIGMVTVLLAGMNLIAVALVYWCTEVLGRLLRTVAAYRVCPGLSNRLRNADLPTIRQMARFGGKLYLAQISQVVMNQTTSVLISAAFGPAFLALYARPRALVRQAAVFPQKYAFMLVPKAAVLAGRHERPDLAALAIESTRNGLYVALPLTALLVLSGGNLLSLWMGPDFASPVLLAVLALGFLSESVHAPLASILVGLDHHGRPALASLIGAVTAVAAVALVLFTGHANLVAVALAVTIPWSITHGVFVPLYACSKLKLSPVRFFLESWARPVLCVFPLAACLTAANVVYPTAAFKALAAGTCAGAIALAATYWRWALPVTLKQRLVDLTVFRDSKTFSSKPTQI